MSHAIRALILIKLEARRGTWCALPWLAESLGVEPAMVQPDADRLVASGALQASRAADGTPIYGAHMDSAAPIPATTGAPA